MPKEGKRDLGGGNCDKSQSVCGALLPLTSPHSVTQPTAQKEGVEGRKKNAGKDGGREKGSFSFSFFCWLLSAAAAVVVGHTQAGCCLLLPLSKGGLRRLLPPSLLMLLSFLRFSPPPPSLCCVPSSSFCAPPRNCSHSLFPSFCPSFLSRGDGGRKEGRALE